jgi:hypothetical protein
MTTPRLSTFAETLSMACEDRAGRAVVRATAVRLGSRLPGPGFGARAALADRGEEFVEAAEGGLVELDFQRAEG